MVATRSCPAASCVGRILLAGKVRFAGRRDLRKGTSHESPQYKRTAGGPQSGNLAGKSLALARHEGTEHHRHDPPSTVLRLSGATPSAELTAAP